MTEKEKFDYLIEKGYYATECGKVISYKGKSIGAKTLYDYLVFANKINKKRYETKNHRFIFYYFFKILPTEVDHINGIRYDNRIINLRSSNKQQNQQNQTKAKGYNWKKENKKWQANIKVNKKTIYLGLFDTEAEARQSYLDAKKIYHTI